MAGSLEATLDGRGVKVALVVSRFNDAITRQLLAGAEACLDEHGCEASCRTVVHVPGAWELTQTAQRLVEQGGHDAIIALGAIIRGETAHFDLLAAECARGLGEVARESRVPLVFGVLTTDDAEQARNRCGGRKGNKGVEAAEAALEMIGVYRALAGIRPGR